MNVIKSHDNTIKGCLKVMQRHPYHPNQIQVQRKKLHTFLQQS